MSSAEKLIFELGAAGRRAATMTAMDVPAEELESMIPAGMIRQEDAPLPEVSEIDIVPLYAPVPAQLRRGYGLLPARLLHHEV
jgi:glycine dehydrogenase subunit 2